LRSGGEPSISLSPFITINWDAPFETNGAPILGFKVEMSVGGASGPYSVAYDGSSNPTLKSFKFQDLSAGQLYHFRVAARNVKGWSPFGAPIAIIAATMPFKMDPLTIGTITPNGQLSTLVVQWIEPTENGGSPITGYYLQRNSGYGTPFIEPGTLVAYGATSFTFTNLVAGANYTFRIAAINTIYTTNKFADDFIHFSEGTTHIVALVPDQVIDLHQIPYNYVKGTIKLLWSEPANIHGSEIKSYTIMRDVGSGVFYPLYTGYETSYIDRNLVEG